MKESIAQTFIINLILFFFIILILLLFGSINYSKAYKAKNRIIVTIEKYGKWDNDVRTEVENNLNSGGYQTVVVTGKSKCDDIDTNGGELIFPTKADVEESGRRVYEYCIIQHKSGLGNYYQVVTFMRFEVPIIGNTLVFPVNGETKELFENIEG